MLERSGNFDILYYFIDAFDTVWNHLKPHQSSGPKLKIFQYYEYQSKIHIVQETKTTRLLI